MNKPCSLLALAILALGIIQPPHAHAADARRPNVLLIVADDLGYGELTTQGYTKEIPTPNIDSIAQSGVRFTSGYVSGPYCSPTRAGLMTGATRSDSVTSSIPAPPRQPWQILACRWMRRPSATGSRPPVM